MSNDRIFGMIWGFNIGMALMMAIYVHPAMIAFAFLNGWASWAFAKANRSGGDVGGARE